MKWDNAARLERELFELPDDMVSVLEEQEKERMQVALERARRDAQPWDWAFMDREPFRPETRAFARRMADDCIEDACLDCWEGNH